MWRESLHCTLVWMILQTKHEITSIHLNDQLHWLYLANSNNLPLLLHTPPFLLALSFPLHLSNLIFHSSLPPNLIPPFSHFNSPVQCALSFTVPARCLSFKAPPFISFFPSLPPLWFISLFLCLLSGVCCSFSVFLLLGVAPRNPPGSLRITAYYWLGLPDRKVDDGWQQGTANANGDL